MPEPMTDSDIAALRKEIDAYHASAPDGSWPWRCLALIARVEADRQKIARLVVALSEARHVIDTKYGPPGTNRLDRETLSKIDAALGREEGK